MKALATLLIALASIPAGTPALASQGDPTGTPTPQENARKAAPRNVLRLLVRTGFERREPRVVPNLTFEFGTQPHPYGKHEGGKLGQGTTDENGELLLELPWSQLDQVTGRKPQLWGAVAQAGYAPWRYLVPIPSAPLDKTEPFELLIQPWPGGVVRGTVVGPDGKPAEAKVTAKETNARNTFAWGSGQTVKGSFEFMARKAGKIWFLAEGELGTGVLGPIELDLARPPQDLQLRLVGPGSIYGTVIDSQGRPVAGLEVIALATDASACEGHLNALPVTVSERLEREGRGAYWRMDTTDDSGSFSFQGLRDDLFVVRARTQPTISYPNLLTPTPIVSDGQARRFVFDRPHISVRIQGADGSPIRCKLLDQSIYKPELAEAWPPMPCVLLISPPGGAYSLDDRKVVSVGKELGDGSVVFETPDGGEWLLMMLGNKQAPLIEKISFEKDSGVIEHVFTLGDELTMGFLEVEVFGPAGKQVRDDVSLRILDPITGACFLKKQDFYTYSEKGQWPSRFCLPPGDYLLHVESIAAVESWHGTMMAPRKYGDHRAPFSVRPGETTKIEALLSAPAYLELMVAGSLDESDREALGEYAEQALFQRAEVRLRPKASYPFPVFFRVKGTYGPRLAPDIALGERAKSEAIAPGEYRLEVSLPGGRTQSRDIVLIEGQTLAVTFDLGGD